MSPTKVLLLAVCKKLDTMQSKLDAVESQNERLESKL
jgi:hypothetical protein